MPPEIPQDRNDKTAARPQPECEAPASSLAALKRHMRFAVAYPGFLYGLVRGYLYDFRRYYNSASKGHAAVRARTRYTELKSWIAADAHKIEKGLALETPRPGFGKAVIRRLIENVEAFHGAFGAEQITRIAANVLIAYCDFNKEHGAGDAALERQVTALARRAEALDCTTAEGGVKQVSRASILARANTPGIDGFFASRHSVRHFSGEPVSLSAIENAVRIALHTPSVCNRQSWKVYAYLDEKDRKEVLACQQGNRGFGDSAGGALVVTADQATFFSYGERNQAWVDGGMFAMSLVYGLHAHGLGTCCLNWCAELKHDRQLRRLIGLPDSEVVIMMIAVGCLPEELNVAFSSRKTLDNVLAVGALDDTPHPVGED